MKRLIASAVAAAVVGCLGAFSAVPAAATTFYQNYLVNPTYDIRSIVLLQYTATGGGSTNSFGAFAPSTMITDPFLKTEDITGTYFLGVSNYGPAESEPTDHLVLALDDDFAAGILGFDFADLFPGFEESGLIAALDLLASPDTEDNLDDKELAFDLIGTFSDQVRTNGGTFGSVDTFSLVGFSAGAAVGSGESSITVVPEPATWALMIAGFGGAGAMLRRRRSTDASAAA